MLKILLQYLLDQMKEFDPDLDLTKYQNLSEKEFWGKLKDEYNLVDNIRMVLNMSVSAEYLRKKLKDHGYPVGLINYSQICKDLNWASFQVGVAELYKTMSLRAICEYIGEKTGHVIHPNTIGNWIEKAGDKLRPKGGANMPGCKKASEVWLEMQKFGLDKIKTMKTREICRQFDINAPMFFRIRDKHSLEYNKPVAKITPIGAG